MAVTRAGHSPVIARHVREDEAGPRSHQESKSGPGSARYLGRRSCGHNLVETRKCGCLVKRGGCDEASHRSCPSSSFQGCAAAPLRAGLEHTQPNLEKEGKKLQRLFGTQEGCLIL